MVTPIITPLIPTGFILRWDCTLAGFGAGDITVAGATMAVTTAAGIMAVAEVTMAAAEVTMAAAGEVVAVGIIKEFPILDLNLPPIFVKVLCNASSFIYLPVLR